MCTLKFGNLFIMIVFVLILHAESTRRNSRRRNARFLSFDTNVDGDISVDLDFTIPFLKIPIKKTMDSAFSTGFGLPTINVNLIGVALGGIVILGSALILPFLLKSYSVDNDNRRFAKLIDYAEFNPETILEYTNKLFGSQSRIQDCSLQLACLAAHQAKGLNSMHILKQIASNNLLSKIMNTTSLDEAIQTGWEGSHCEHRCPMMDDQLNGMLKTIHGLGNR